uniref:Histidine triad nucleotide-binding protein 3-like n=1 Tax=Mastacembelus armatus TaxID=205130 RepID=A0A7N8Y1X7_9TELE
GVSKGNLPQGKGEASSTEECPFCHIANNRTDREILLSDDVLVCFRDVKPGATHHYLVVPRTHINNCKSLQRDDIPLGDPVLNLNSEFTFFISQLRYGSQSYWFITVSHIMRHSIDVL